MHDFATLTLSQVLADFSIDEADVCGLALGDIERTPGEDIGAAAAWAWVQGLPRQDADQGCHATLLGPMGDGTGGDVGLYLAMHAPVAEALHWWRRMDWGTLASDEGGPPSPAIEAWAWGVLEQLLRLASSLGPILARQVSVVEAVRRAPPAARLPGESLQTP